MKNVVARGVAKAGLLAAMIVIAASVSANAQSLQYRLTANIPFDFSVAGKKTSGWQILDQPLATGNW